MPHVEVREEHAPVLEDVEEGDLTVGSLDGGVVGDLRHGQAAACGGDRVSLASVRLLSSKEVVAGVLPGTAVDHLGRRVGVQRLGGQVQSCHVVVSSRVDFLAGEEADAFADDELVGHTVPVPGQDLELG